MAITQLAGQCGLGLTTSRIARPVDRQVCDGDISSHPSTSGRGVLKDWRGRRTRSCSTLCRAEKDVSLYQARERYRDVKDPSLERKTILVCTNKTCRRDGSLQTLQYFKEMAPPHIAVESTGCVGKCGAGPNCVLLPDELFVSHVNTASHVAKLLGLQCGAGDPEANLKAASLKAAATDAFEHGDPAKAEQLYTKAVELNPPSGLHSIYANRSAARLALGNAEGALEDARAAAEIAPSWAGAFMRQGEAYSQLGNTDAAVAAYSTAATLDSSLLKKVRRKVNQLRNSVTTEAGVKNASRR